MSIYGRDGVGSQLPGSYDKHEQSVIAQGEAVHKDDPTTRRQRAWMEFWREQRIKPAKAWWDPVYDHMREARHVYDGESYVYIDPTTGKLVAPDKAVKDPRIPRRNANFYASLWDAIVARMLSDRPVGRALPGNPALSATRHKQVARVSNDVILHIDRANGGETQLQQHALAMCLCGVSYLRGRWDGNFHAVVKVSGTDGKSRYDFNRVGEVCNEVIDPLTCIYDPAAPWSRRTWFARIYQRPLGWVRQTWPNGRYVVPKSLHERATWNKEAQSRGIPCPRTGADDRDGALVDIWETYVWERDDEEKKVKIYLFEFCEDTCLSAGSDGPGPAAIPIFGYTPSFFNWSQAPGREGAPWTPAFDIANIQREIDKAIEGQSFRRILHQFVKPGFPEGGVPPKWDNSPDPVELKTDDQGRLIEPIWLAPPDIDSQGVLSWVGACQSMMMDRLGIHNTSRGVVDPGIKSGIQAQIAEQQATTNLQRAIQNLRESLGEHWFKLIRLADENYDAQKMLMVVGKRGQLDIRPFEEGVLGEVAMVRMSVMSRIPMDPQSRTDLVKWAAEAGYLEQGRERAWQRVLEYLDVGAAVEDEIDEVAVAEAQQEAENELLEKGQQVEIGPFELDEVHILICARRMNAPDFKEKVRPEIREVFEEHVRGHMDMIQRKAAEMAEAEARVQVAQQKVIGEAMAQAQPAMAPEMVQGGAGA